MRGNSRIKALDLFRGLAVMLMVFHHSAYSYYYVFEGEVNLYTPFLTVAPIVVCVFFTISGICSSLSRNNFKRGLKALVCAFAISIVTYFLGEEYLIVFGVIHCFAACILIHALIGEKADDFLGNLTPVFYLVLFLISNAFGTIIVNNPFLFPFGFVKSGFYSADYYPIFPWIFMYLFGCSISKWVVAERRMPQWFYKISCPPVEWIGKNALVIYLVHQPLIFVLFYLLNLIV